LNRGERNDDGGDDSNLARADTTRSVSATNDCCLPTPLVVAPAVGARLLGVALLGGVLTLGRRSDCKST